MVLRTLSQHGYPYLNLLFWCCFAPLCMNSGQRVPWAPGRGAQLLPESQQRGRSPPRRVRLGLRRGTSSATPRAAPRVPRATRLGRQYSAKAASQTPRTAPACCPPGSRGLHRRAADAAALRRRLPALSTEQTSGGTAFHQLQEVRTSQRKHRMLPQFTQLCAAQRTGHATQSRPSAWPRGCLRKAWQRVLASSAATPSARASEQRERGHNHFWNPGPLEHSLRFFLAPNTAHEATQPAPKRVARRRRLR